MRVFAILLIVSSHFRSDKIIDFEPFLFYDRFGFLGNMIFFFISAYAVSLNFVKYEQQKMNWLVYRLFYLCFIILSVKIMFGVINGDIPDIINMLELHKIGFISVMFLFSIFFPLLWSLSRNIRLGLVITLSAYCIISFLVFDTRLPMVGVSEYLLVFLLGILLSKNEIKINFHNPLINIFCLMLTVFIAVLSKFVLDSNFLYSFSRIFFICFLLASVEQINFVRIPLYINESVKIIATLSLFIYLSHAQFNLINWTYHLNKFFAVPILIIIIFPMCLMEQKILDPIALKVKGFVIKK